MKHTTQRRKTKVSDALARADSSQKHPQTVASARAPLR